MKGTIVKLRQLDWLPGYKFGIDGSVWSYRKYSNGLKLKLYFNKKNGYSYLSTGNSTDKRGRYHVARLICEAFHGIPNIDDEVRHLNGDKLDNRAVNLLWGTSLDNKRDRHHHGTTARGIRHGLSKLNEQSVRDIFVSIKTHTILAKQYGVSRYTVWAVKNCRTWVHVTKEIR